MKGYILTFLLILSLFSNCPGQKAINGANHVPLFNGLGAQTIEDSTRISRLIKHATEYTNVDVDSSIKYSNWALNIARRNEDPAWIFVSLLSLGRSYSEAGLIEKALVKEKEALSIAKHLEGKSRRIAAFSQIAASQYLIGANDSSILFYEKAIDLAHNMSDNQLGKLYVGISGPLISTGQFNKALKYLNDAETQLQHWGTLEELGSVYFNMGRLAFSLGDFSTAIFQMERSKRLFERTYAHHKTIGALNAIGAIYGTLDSLLQAKKIFTQVRFLAKKFNYQDREGLALHNLGECYQNMGKPDSAMWYYLEAIRTIRPTGIKDQLGKEYAAIAGLYINQQETKKAIQYLDSTMHYMLGTQEISKLEYVYEQYLQVYRNENNIQKQNQYLEKILVIRDSINQRNIQAELQKLQVEYEFAIKEEKIKTQLAQILKIEQKNDYLLFIGLLIISSVATVFWLSYRKREEHVGKIVSRLELKALQAQMNPHFLSNTLSAIRDEIHEQGPKAGETFLMKFSQYMRSIFEHSFAEEIDLHTEIESLNTYFELMKLRFPNLNYSISTPQDVDCEAILIPPFLIQPFIENSINHGLAPKKGVGRIDVNFRIFNDSLITCITDDGIGLKEQQGSSISFKGRSSELISDRLHIIQIQQKREAGFSVQSLLEGVKVEITLPLVYQF